MEVRRFPLGRRAAVVATMVALAAACGGGDDSDSNESEQSVDSAGASTVEADQEIAEAALLVLADFPSGWSEVPPSADVDEDVDEDLTEVRTDFAGCAASEGDRMFDFGTGRAETGHFTSPEGNQISQTVVVASQAETEDFMDRFGKSGVDECLADVVRKVIEFALAKGSDVPEGVTFGDPTGERLDLAPAGDELVAYRVAMPVEAEGVVVSFYLDFVVVRVGRAVSELGTEPTVSPFPATEIDNYLALASDRLAGALDS